MYLLAVIVISPVVAYRMVRHKRYRLGWVNRFGRIARKSPEKKCIWIHAVSVGEVNATKTIIEELENRFSDFEIVISTTTDTGFARATSLYGDSFAVFYFPLDFSLVMRRAFGNIKPSLCLLMELEIWPNFVEIAQRSNVPVVVINGRLSKNSFSKYKMVRPIAKAIFEKTNLILAQTAEYAERFRELGTPAENVIVTGSVKYDTAQTEKVAGVDELACQLNIDDGRLWVAGGTGNDEEKILLATFKNLKQQEQFGNLRLAIIPRKPERFDEVAELIEQMGFGLVRYSQIKDGAAPPPTDNQAVILGDTMGDLRKFYSLASIIFVGRTLVSMGGSDMMEAAALGRCTIFGPYAFNFKQTVEALLAGDGAIMVKDGEDLLRTMQKCLVDADFAERIARNGQEVIRKNQGATAKSISEIAKLLNSD